MKKKTLALTFGLICLAAVIFFLISVNSSKEDATDRIKTNAKVVFKEDLDKKAQAISGSEPLQTVAPDELETLTNIPENKPLSYQKSIDRLRQEIYDFELEWK